MTKLKMHSKDLTQDNIEKIKALFPNCVSEAANEQGELRYAVDFDLLKQELSDSLVEGPQERYRLDWPGKREAMLLANSPIAKTLRPARDESVDFDSTENLFIEGDNLEALKLLQENYLGKVKMIYIDPPYNTGNDFVYNDDFAESSEEYFERSIQKDEEGNRLVANTESNGRYHSDWLSMMLPRLKLARNLLSDDGVIFISIDDNEQGNLKKVCDEVFGVENFIESVVWKNKYGAGAKTKGFINAHEYVLCYGRQSISNITCEFEGAEKDKYSKRDEKFDTRGPYRTQPLMTNSLGDRPNLMYPIEYNGVSIYPCKQWVWSKERMLKAIENNDVEFTLQSDGGYSVRSKSYLYDESGAMRRGKPISILNGPFTQEGTKEIRLLFDDKIIFDFSKPSKLIEYFLKLEVNNVDTKDFIILDFFAGSSATAHAVMQLNAEDGGNRKFIMVQLPEAVEEKHEAFKAGYKTIAEISKERIRRAGKQILEGECHENWNKDVGFRVLKVDSTNMKDVYYRPAELGQQDLANLVSPIKEDRSNEDLLFQVMLDLGLELNLPIRSEDLHGKTVFFVDENLLVACFDQDISEELVLELTQHKPVRVVFADSCFGANDSLKTNVQQIFKQQSPDTSFKGL